jgi:hypothetical protein
VPFFNMMDAHQHGVGNGYGRPVSTPARGQAVIKHA